MVPTVTFPAASRRGAPSCPGSTGCMAAIRSARGVHRVAVDRGDDVARLRPALAAGSPAGPPASARPAARSARSCPARARPPPGRSAWELAIAWKSSVTRCFSDSPGSQHLVVGHQLGAVDQVLRPELLDQVRLQLVDVDEVEARSRGRRLAAGHVHDVGGRVGLVGQEGEVAGLASPAVGAHGQHEEDTAADRQPRPAQHDPQHPHPPATASDPATRRAAISHQPQRDRGRQPAVGDVAAAVAGEHHADQHAADQPADVTADRDARGSRR